MPGTCWVHYSDNYFDNGIKGVNWIIDAVGPNYNDVEPKDMNKAHAILSTTYADSLYQADKRMITHIAFPFISGDIFSGKIAKKQLLKNAIKVMYYARLRHVKEIYFVFLHRKMAELAKEAYEEIIL